MRDNPFVCNVYDKRRDWVGRIADPVSIAGSVRFNAMGGFEYRLRAKDPMIEDVMKKGARVAMQYRDEDLFSGMVRTKNGSLLPNGDVVFQVQDDWRMLVNTLALVRPGGSLTPTSLVATTEAALGQAWLEGAAGPDGTTQGQSGYFSWPDSLGPVDGLTGLPTATAEAAIRYVILVNLAERLGLPVTLNPDLGRGGDVRGAGMLPAVRMAKVSEAVEPLLEWAGLGLRMLQRAGSSAIEAEVYEPTPWAAPLSVGSGIIPKGDWTLGAPNATRAIVGGPGEGADRVFAEVRDGTGLEDDYGDIIEVFRDATGANLKWPSSLAEAYQVPKYFDLRPEVPAADKVALAAYLRTAGRKGLSEGAPTTGVQAALSETPGFHFGGADGVHLGDPLTIKDASGSIFTDRVTEAKFSLTASGLTVEPVLGQKVDDPNLQLARAVANLATAQRRMSASR